MKLPKSVSLSAIRPSGLSSETLAATIPLITKGRHNETQQTNETDKHQDPKSPETGLGSDLVNTSHGLTYGSHIFEATPKNIKA